LRVTITSSPIESSFASPLGLTLRERKKRQTRAAIQREALRLFRERGYSATTCEQIAAAADVSPATFYRYFPTKEDVVLTDDYDPLLIARLAGRPAEEGPLAAIRAVIKDTVSAVYAADEGAIRERTKLTLSVPEIRARVYDQFQASAVLLTKELGPRMGAGVDGLRSRVVAAAIASALMVALETWAENDGDLPSIALAALDVLGKDLR
jgi:AcrR family transcriptional regulator